MVTSPRILLLLYLKGEDRCWSQGGNQQFLTVFIHIFFYVTVKSLIGVEGFTANIKCSFKTKKLSDDATKVRNWCYWIWSFFSTYNISLRWTCVWKLTYNLWSWVIRQKSTLLRTFYLILRKWVDRVWEQCVNVTDWGHEKIIWWIPMDCWVKSKHINMLCKDPPSCFHPNSASTFTTYVLVTLNKLQFLDCSSLLCISLSSSNLACHLYYIFKIEIWRWRKGKKGPKNWRSEPT